MTDDEIDSYIESQCRAYIDNYVRPNASLMAKGEGGNPHTVIEDMARNRLAGLMIPIEYGGLGGSHRMFSHVIESIAAVCASTSVIVDVHISVVAYPICQFGTDEQKARYLPLLASGEWLGAFALTEPQGGSDAAALETRAERDGQGYCITGTKTFITNAGAADIYIVMARTGDDRARGITAFIIEAKAQGVHWGSLIHKMGLHGSWTREVIFDHVHVGAEQRLGEEGEGFRIAMQALDRGRIGIAAQAVGIARGALDVTMEEAGNSDGEWSAIAELDSHIEAARQMTEHAARAVDAHMPATRIAAAAKVYASDMCVETTQAAMELCAPNSAHEDHPVAIAFRDAKASQIYEGTNQVQRIIIARALLHADIS